MIRTPEQSRRPEMLLDNILDKEIQSLLLPMNIIHALCFSSRCDIRHGFITPKSLLSNIVSLLGTLFFIGLWVIRLFIMFNMKFYSDHFEEWTFCACFDLAFYSIVMLTNIFVIIWQSPNYVNLILKLRDVNNVLNCEKNSKRIRRLNWLPTYILGAFYIIFIGNCFSLMINTIDTVCLSVLVTFDIQSLYARNLTFLIRNKLQLWIRKVKSYTALEKRDTEDSVGKRQEVFNCYFKLMEAYSLLKVVFRVGILLHTVETFIHALIYVGFVVQICKMFLSDEKFIVQASRPIELMFLWILKNLVLEKGLSIECEMFYSTVRKAQTTSLVYMYSEECSGLERKLCKNIRREHRSGFSEMRACSLYRSMPDCPLAC